MAKEMAGGYTVTGDPSEGRVMIETRIELPGAPAEVRALVEAADAILREEAEKLKGLALDADWKSLDPPPVPYWVRLTLRLGTAGMSFGFEYSQLANPKEVRATIRQSLWGLATNYAETLRQDVIKLRKEMKPELEAVGA